MMLFMLSVLASLIAGMLLQFVQSRGGVREYLAKSHSGWRRRRYVRVFIDAVRGESHASDSRLTGLVLVVFPLGVLWIGALGLLPLMGLQNYHSGRSDRNQLSSRGLQQLIDAMDTRSESELRTAMENFPTEVNEVDQNEELQAALENVNEAIERLDITSLARSDVKAVLLAFDESEAAIEEGQANLSRWVAFAWTVVAVGMLWYMWFLGVWLPFIEFRSQFSFELERFVLRIQGLASKKELAELIRLEAAVRDEESAKSYVAQMATIAARHGVEQLVDTFLLWDKVRLPAADQPADQSSAGASGID